MIRGNSTQIGVRLSRSGNTALRKRSVLHICIVCNLGAVELFGEHRNPELRSKPWMAPILMKKHSDAWFEHIYAIRTQRENK